MSNVCEQETTQNYYILTHFVAKFLPVHSATMLQIQKTDAMYTAPCTGSVVFLCTRPRVRLSSVAYVHDIVFTFQTDYLMYP